MEVRLLGTGGWLPTNERETACMYVRSGPDVLAASEVGRDGLVLV